MFLASSLLGVTASEITNDDCEADDFYQANEGSLTYVENTAYVGKTWTSNEEDILVGNADLEIENQTVDWYVEPSTLGASGEVARGMVDMDVFKFVFNDGNNSGNALPLPSQLWDRYSNYELSIYDGESTDDDVLLQDSIPFVGGGIEFTKLSSLLSVETNNKPSRTFAFEATAQTQTYSPALRFSFQGAPGLKSKVGHMIINFISPSVVLTKDRPENNFNNIGIADSVDFDVGEIKIQTVWGDNAKDINVPKAYILLNQNKDVQINESEKVDVHATLDWSIDLTEKVRPPLLSFMKCDAEFSLRAIVLNLQGDNEPRWGKTKNIILTNNLKKNDTLTLDFTVDTGLHPTYVMFHVNYALKIYPTSLPVFHERAGDSRFNYIYWHES